MMNDATAGCFACAQDIYTPSDVYAPTDDLVNFWYSLDGPIQGLLVSGIALALIFVVAPQLIKRRRRR